MSDVYSHGTHGLLFIVDIGVYDVEIKKVNVVNGDLLLRSRVIDRDFNNKALQVIELVKKEKPQKIIFDKAGIGKAFYELFMSMLDSTKDTHGISVDSFGNVSYNYFNLNPTYNITINMNSEKDVNMIAEEMMKSIKKLNLKA